MNFPTQESEKIPWKTRKGVKDHVGHQVLLRAAKCVTQRDPPRLAPCPSNQSTASMGRTEFTNCNVTQDKDRRVAAVLATVMGSLAATISSVCCNHISRLLLAVVKTQELDSLNQRRRSNKKRIQQRMPLVVPLLNAVENNLKINITVRNETLKNTLKYYHNILTSAHIKTAQILMFLML